MIKMQYHALTLGRNVGDAVDAIPVETAIKFVDSELNSQYGVDSFSVYQGCGYWCGIRENTVRFEVYGLSDCNAKQLAATIAKQFNQEAVMLLSINSRPKFIKED
jgi:hypothetical protein